MNIIIRTIGAQQVSGNVDRVVCAVPLPKGGKLKGVQGEVHVIGEEDQPTNQFMAWGISGHMVPVEEAETALEFGVLWDQVIVKSADPTTVAATTVLDWDWDTADLSVELEPGEMDINSLLGLSQRDKEFMAPRIEWTSFAKGRQGGFAAGSPDTYLPTDYKTFRSKINLTAEGPSAAMIGFSSPVLDETKVQTADQTPGSAAEWYMLQNMRETLRDMGKAQAGLIEATSDHPYADASTLIGNLVAPDMLDESSTLYNSISWRCLIVATWLLEFPGDSIPNTLDGR
jgi:hypothetical protein